MGTLLAGWDPAAPTRGAKREEVERKGPRAARARRQLGGCRPGERVNVLCPY